MNIYLCTENFRMKNFYYKIYNFIAWRHTVFWISIFLIFLSFMIVMMQGFNLGLDFTGGILIEITVDRDTDINSIKNAFIQSGFMKVIVQRFGISPDLIIKLSLVQNNDLVKENIINILNKNIVKEFVIKQINWIGPTVSNNLIQNGIIAVLGAMICILIYITLRFEWRLALGTIISLIHDIIIIIGIISLLSIEIDSIVIAALMSVIGYSLNDKIVIFDRIRENFRCISELNSIDILNISISQVLHRTIITSVTTEVVLLILLIFGGPILYGFSIILLIGVIIGTISSIYIASILAFKFGVKHKHF